MTDPRTKTYIYTIICLFYLSCSPELALLRKSLFHVKILHRNLLTNARTMREWYQSCYKAVTMEEQRSTSPAKDSVLHLYHSTVEHQTVFAEKQNKPQPRPLGASWPRRVLRLMFDLIVGSVALLFAIFGIWVYRIDGNVVSPETTGSKLLRISQYVSYPDPILTRSSR